jgi:hypothetical protein
MATGKEIEAGARVIAEDLCLPGGALKKLARVVEDHLDWFDMAEARGLTWADMSRLLFAAGAKSRKGRPFSVGTLYSTVWRKREDSKRIGGPIVLSSKSAGQGSAQESPPRKGQLNSDPIRSGNVEHPRKRRQVRRSTFENPAHRSTKAKKKQVEASTGRSSPTQSEKISQKASSKDLLAYMRRSAAVRGFKSGK